MRLWEFQEIILQNTFQKDIFFLVLGLQNNPGELEQSSYFLQISLTAMKLNLKRYNVYFPVLRMDYMILYLRVNAINVRRKYSN